MERTVQRLMLGIIKNLVNNTAIDPETLLEAQKSLSCALTKAKVLGEPTEALEAELEDMAELNEILNHGMEL